MEPQPRGRRRAGTPWWGDAVTGMGARAGWLIAALALLPSLTLAPGTALQAGYFQVVALGCIVLALVGVRANRPRRVFPWLLIVAGQGLFWVGDALWAQAVLRGEAPFPSAADIFYLAGYPFIATGLATLVRSRHRGPDRSSWLDAAIICAGVAVLTSVFLVIPFGADQGQPLLAQVVARAYPVGDLLLVGLMGRLWAKPGRRTPSLAFLTAGLGTLVVADTGFALTEVLGIGGRAPVLELAWLAAYVLVTAAVLHPSMAFLSEPGPVHSESLTRGRLAMLTVAVGIAPVTLLVEAALGRPVHAGIIGVGSLTVFSLVVARMAGLLHQLQDQAAQLEARARNDHLTGMPNRRSWDHELTRACAAARTEGTPLCIAMIDLDRFKAYNDSHGHQAGDLLLKEATAAWQASLGPEVILARYGGEEFAVLLPGIGLEASVAALEALRTCSPSGQTFSAGVTCWDGMEAPVAAVARADRALYAAKAGGRDQVVVDRKAPGGEPRVRIAEKRSEN